MSEKLVPTGHTAAYGGLQNHSVGSTYPYVVIGKGEGFCRLNTTTNEEGPLRETYGKANADIILAKTEDTIVEGCKNPAYKAGFYAYTFNSKEGNPYNPDDRINYGLFGSGFFEARSIEGLQKFADRNWEEA